MYIRPYVIINGVNSTTITGLLVTDLGATSKPLVRTLVEEVDGRDGDIVTPLGFSAYDRVIKIALTSNYNIDEVIKFFNSEGVITFSSEPEKYYRFAIYEQIDFERLIRYKTAEVTLHIQPFKFSLEEREQETNISVSPATVNVYNSGNYYASPIIKITGSGDITVSLNGSQVLTLALGDISQTIIINCEAMNAYSLDNTLLNRLVTGNYDNIKIAVGNNVFTLAGSVTKFVIDKYSRWL